MAVIPVLVLSTFQDPVERSLSPKSSDEPEPIIWRESHRNPVANRLASWHEGPVITIDDKMWDNVKDGESYVIAVRACARFGGWKNYGEEAELRVWKHFEPIVES